MNHSEAAQDDPIAYVHMACELGTVGKNSVIANLAIMCQVHISHDPVVISELGDAGVARRANVEGAKLSDGVAIANDQLARLTCIFLVLGDCAQGVELKNFVVFADGGMAFNDAMATVVPASMRTWGPMTV